MDSPSSTYAKTQDIDEDVANEYNDVDAETLAAVEQQKLRLFKRLKKDKYQMDKMVMIILITNGQYWTPFGPPDSEIGNITTQNVATNLTAIVDDPYDFYSSVPKMTISNVRFLSRV